MNPTLKACAQAMLTALTNGALAFLLMLVAEFAISGTIQVTAPYLWAGLLVWLVIFIGQFWRRLHICRRNSQREVSD
ncbi:hypothetical protein [Marinobacter sp. X15-166B]|uniref:hypothetical protein n=1 Tax=Marinobacter sp. X15-166B TaxID=1897620 RepID=UPI00085C954E|nr:hypothetical protein [Marinobacter sp. X15-166B]OEY65260.1 hypothetical protein BG841_01475 [Marinobacter sp. X15-166B]